MLSDIPCRICASRTEHSHDSTILGKFQANYRYCKNCGFLFISNPSWLQEAYSSAIASADTGIIARNIFASQFLSALIPLVVPNWQKAQYLDYSGGYGLLTRLMRDIGFDFSWHDPYAENLFARGFGMEPGQSYALASAFEVFEHLEDPLGYLDELVKLSGAPMIIFTTELFEHHPPAEDWRYYAHETGQHIAFYQFRTLETLSASRGFRYYPADPFHVFSRKPLSRLKLRLAAGRTRLLWRPWLRRKLVSRMVLDHDLIVARLVSRT